MPRRGLSRVVAILLVLGAIGIVLAPAASARAIMPLHFTAQNLAFTSFDCPDPANPFLCNVTATAEVRSNLSTTPGAVDYTLGIDFSPGFDAPCNVVDETAVFTFDAGTITTHSHHQDCPATIRPGPRIDTGFVVTSGTVRSSEQRVAASNTPPIPTTPPSSTTARSPSDRLAQRSPPAHPRIAPDAAKTLTPDYY
jgi:hypothetical protein